jgi:hypothetical protein
MTDQPRTRYPLPDHPTWTAFMDGYLAGITYGIGMGRAQVSQEYAEAEIFPIGPRVRPPLPG